jgi:hypothetical protein
MASFTEGFPTAGTYRGSAEVQEHVAKGRGTWAEGTCEPEKFLTHGDKGDQAKEFYMNVQEQIKEYIATQPESKRSDLQELHRIILELMPDCKLWFLDGKDEQGRTVSNPNIGYGVQTRKYANGKTKEFYQIGISANTTGISVYILGIEDKKYLAETYGKELGKASVSGYCIKFKTLKAVNMAALKAAMRYGIEQTSI